MRYDFPDKQSKYRIPLWNAIDRLIKKPKALRRVAYLEVSQGLETIHLLNSGYKPENLYAVNRNPAEVAALTFRLKRLGLPLVNTYGVDLLKACERIGECDVINYDGVSNFSDSARHLLSRYYELTRFKVIGYNLLVGRENDLSKIKCLGNMPVQDFVFDSFGRSGNRKSRERIGAMMNFAGIRDASILTSDGRSLSRPECWFHWRDMKWSDYISVSGQRFAWFAASVVPHSQDANGQIERRFFVKNGGIVLVCNLIKKDPLFRSMA